MLIILTLAMIVLSLLIIIRWKKKGILLLFPLIGITIMSILLVSHPIFLQKSTDLSGIKISEISYREKEDSLDLLSSDKNIEGEASYTLKSSPEIYIGVNEGEVVQIASDTNQGLEYEHLSQYKEKYPDYKEFSTDQYPSVVRLVDKKQGLKLELYSNDKENITAYSLRKI